MHSTAPADCATGHSLVVSYPPVGAYYRHSRLGQKTLVGCVLSPSQCNLQPQPTGLQNTRWLCLIPSRCILQPRPTGLQDTRWLCIIPQSVHSTAPADWATEHSLVVSYPPVGAFYSPGRLGYRTFVCCVLSPSRCILLGYRTLVGCVLYPSRCNLQPQPTGLQDTRLLYLIPHSVHSTAPADWATGHSLVVTYPQVGAFYSPSRLDIIPKSVHSTALADWATGNSLVVSCPPVSAFYSPSRLCYRTLVGCVLSPVGAYYRHSRLGQKTLVGCVLSPSQCNLQPQPTGLQNTRWLCLIPQSVHSTAPADWATGHSLVVYYPPVGAFYSPSRLGYRTLVGCVLSPSRCILQPRPTRLQDIRLLCIIPSRCILLGYRTLVGCVLYPSRCNLQPQPTGLQDTRLLYLIPHSVHSTAPADWATGHSLVVYLSPGRCILQPQPTRYYPQVGAFYSRLGYRTLVCCVLSPSRCILQPQPTGLQDTRRLCLIP